MSQTVGTLIRHLVLGSFFAILIMAVPAQAVTYQLIATPTDAARDLNGPGMGFGGFSLVYVDQDNDARFEVSELLSFSGLTVGSYASDNTPVYTTYPILLGAAGYQDTPYTDEYSVYEPHDSRSWGEFRTADNQLAMTAGAFNWTYQQEIVPQGNNVPLPPSVLLLGSGLISLAWARRKKRMGK
jgi:hypothetical protein